MRRIETRIPTWSRTAMAASTDPSIVGSSGRAIGQAADLAGVPGPGTKNATDAPLVSVRQVSKRFTRASGAVTAAVDAVDVELRRGEFLVLLGPSGCGKTTLLRTIAGLERPDAGEIDLHGVPCFSAERGVNVATEHRRLSMIFQSYALWPHMTVFDNIAYPLRSQGKKLNRAQLADAVHRVLDLVHIPDLAKQYPGQMSGGQQQRVALARALVAENDVILFDEPLSNVDAKVREQLRFDLVSMQRELGFGAVYVTHDQSEAMGLAHRIAVMDSGSIAQIGSPRDVYERAESRYVADFVGTSNEIPGTIETLDGGQARVVTEVGTFTGVTGTSGLAVGDEVVVTWRPEHAVSHASEPAEANRLHGTIEAALFLGSYTEIALHCGPHRLRLWEDAGADAVDGTEVWITVEPARMRVLPR